MDKIWKVALVASSLLWATSASSAIVVFKATSITPVASNVIIDGEIAPGDKAYLTTEALGSLLFSGDTYEFTFKALSALKVTGISLAGTGFNNGADLAKIEFGLLPTTDEVFTTITPGSGGTASALGSLSAGFTLAKDEMFSIFWDYDGVGAPVQMIGIVETAAIPVPAALPLMLGGIAALGVVSRRKRS